MQGVVERYRRAHGKESSALSTAYFFRPLGQVQNRLIWAAGTLNVPEDSIRVL